MISWETDSALAHLKDKNKHIKQVYAIKAFLLQLTQTLASQLQNRRPAESWLLPDCEAWTQLSKSWLLSKRGCQKPSIKERGKKIKDKFVGTKKGVWSKSAPFKGNSDWLFKAEGRGGSQWPVEDELNTPVASGRAAQLKHTFRACWQVWVRSGLLNALVQLMQPLVLAKSST